MTRATFSIDDRAYRARRRLEKHIATLAEKHSQAIADSFAVLRRHHGLPPALIIDGKSFWLPRRFNCPECQGPLGIDIDEYGTLDGIPTRSGLNVFCAKELDEIFSASREDRDLNWHHRHWFSDWHGVIEEIEKWVLRNVRVSRSS